MPPMKKTIALSLLLILTLAVKAQTIRFAHFSYNEVLRAMPDYAEAQQVIEQLRKQYSDEAQRMANEFSNKYEDLLEDYNTLAPAILSKRQAELQQLAQQGATFKNDAQKLLSQTEDQKLAPVKQRLSDTLSSYAKEQGYAFVINTDGNNLPYVDPAQGDDITTKLKELLQR